MSRQNRSKSQEGGRTGRKTGGRKSRAGNRAQSGRGRTERNGKANRKAGSGATRPSGSSARRPSGSTATRAASKPAASSVRTIKLCINHIKCIKDTKEIDKDEIVCTAIKTMGKVSGKNGRQTIKPSSSRGMTINAGKFKKGTKANYAQAKTIASFPVGANNLPWPRVFPVQLIIVEKDGGKVKSLVDDLIDKFDDAAARELGKAASDAAVDAAVKLIGSAAGVGGVIGSAVPVPVLGTLVGTAVGAGVGAVSAAIRNSSADDMFPPKNVQLKLDEKPASKGRIGSKKTATFIGHKGKYEIAYTWMAS